MRILLIQSPLGRNEPAVYPAGLGYLAGALTGHEMRVYDPNLSPPEALSLEPWRDFAPDIVAISLRNIDSQMLRDLVFYVPPFAELAKRVRDAWPETRIIAGGAGFSLFPKLIMERVPELDCGVYLEGEQSFVELAQGIAPERVKGVFYRLNGAVMATGPREFQPFARLPRCDWQTVNPVAYQAQAYSWGVGVQTKRGCSLRCAYCTYPLLNGRLIRCKPPAQVIDELELLVTNYGIARVMFVDAVFNHPQPHAEAIVRGLLRRGLPLAWTAYFTEKDLTSDFALLAVKSGCAEFSFSPDGTTERSLKMLGKEIRLADIERVMRMPETVPGMKISLGFFINPPGNSWRGFLRLISWLVRSKVFYRSKVGGFTLASPRIEPDTELERIARETGVIAQGTVLLPKDCKELRTLFYRNRQTPYVEWAFQLYIGAWKLSRRLKSGRRRRLALAGGESR